MAKIGGDLGIKFCHFGEMLEVFVRSNLEMPTTYGCQYFWEKGCQKK